MKNTSCLVFDNSTVLQLSFRASHSLAFYPFSSAENKRFQGFKKSRLKKSNKSCCFYLLCFSAKTVHLQSSCGSKQTSHGSFFNDTDKKSRKSGRISSADLQYYVSRPAKNMTWTRIILSNFVLISYIL